MSALARSENLGHRCFGREVRMIHYHIRWANSKFDWEAFPSEEEAKALAELLKHPGENYVIEKLDGNCESCNSLAKAKATIPQGDMRTAS